MSYRSLSFHVRTPSQNFITDRKSDKLSKIPQDKIYDKKALEFNDKKSYSIDCYPLKSNTQRHLKNSGKKQANSKIHYFQKIENKKDLNFMDLKTIKQTSQHNDLQILAIKILKVKKNKKSEAEGNKLQRLQQRFIQFLKVSNNQSENQTIKIKKLGQNEQNLVESQKGNLDECKKQISSVYLQQTNFQDRNLMNQIKIEKQNCQNKKFPSLKMLKRLSQKNDGKGQKRKRIESCKFVINPFKNVQIQKKKRSQQIGQIDGVNKNDQLKVKMEMNQISQIQNYAKSENSQTESMNISILELMNW